MAASKKKKPAEPMKNMSLTDMKRFHASVDWAAWWEEFYLMIGVNGTQKYKSLRAFAKEKSQNELQQRFIEYAAGPDKPIVDVDKGWDFIKPMGWEKKRETGGWYASSTVKEMADSISHQTMALQAMQEVGQKITTKLLTRYEQLAAQLDREFTGRFFADGLNFKDNLLRARLYVSLHKDVLQLMAVAQDMYAKNHGINYQLDGYQQLLLGAKITGEAGDPQQQRIRKVLGSIIDMTLTKNTTHAIPIPPEIEKQVMTLVPAKKPN